MHYAFPVKEAARDVGRDSTTSAGMQKDIRERITQQYLYALGRPHSLPKDFSNFRRVRLPKLGWNWFIWLPQLDFWTSAAKASPRLTLFSDIHREEEQRWKNNNQKRRMCSGSFEASRILRDFICGRLWRLRHVNHLQLYKAFLLGAVTLDRTNCKDRRVISWIPAEPQCREMMGI